MNYVPKFSICLPPAAPAPGQASRCVFANARFRLGPGFLFWGLPAHYLWDLCSPSLTRAYLKEGLVQA